ncbi:MAG: alpha/beta fold hydrolase [Nisaea sp.]|uniref:alpha/beta fold hydrolase n=1 Tax=Nisaea sp. TaxID=2024842 RepID=UPI001B24AEC8|nr:alpha/beta hydrolase [Nisaea sp.]MBO6562741.1 alpha/beta fold hydrolase [Nisaea sp.]
MGYVQAKDGVALYCETTGEGTPVVFVHEFAGDHRSWEPQVRALARYYTCITYSARGYTPSDVPEDVASYSQDKARDDILAVLDGNGIEAAHIVGLSMGGFATLHFGLAYPERALSLVVAGCGYGADPEKRGEFKAQSNTLADRIETEGMNKVAPGYALEPARVQLQNKDPRGWEEFAKQLGEHSSKGSANTLRGVQANRPSLWELEEKMRALTVPTLIVNGDEDESCLEPGLFMKRCIPSAGHAMFPKTGHTLNLEEPDLFNRTILDFFHEVEAGRWALRDPRSQKGGTLGR